MANTKITSKVIADANILTAAIADNAVTGDKVADDVALAGNPTTTTQTAGNSTTRVATTAFVSTAISNLVDSSPSALNTLNELAAAMGDDANFSTTVTNSIAGKVALSGSGQTIADSGNFTIDAVGDITLDAADNQIFFKDAGTTVGTLSMTGADLKFISNVNDKDMIFAGTDNNSEVVALTLDMSAAGEATFSDDINLADGKRLRMGAGGDFEIFHDGSHNYIKGATGDQDLIFQGVDGSSAITALTLDMSAAGKALFNSGAAFNGNVDFADNAIIVVGSGDDLQIYHDGSDSYIKDTGTGNLLIQGSDIYMGDTSNNHAFVIRATGNVGIGGGGTADTKLHLKDTGSIELRLEADSNNSGQEDCFIRFYTDGKTQEGIAGMDNNNSGNLFSGNTENAMVFGTVSNLPTLFATNNIQRVTIEANGTMALGNGDNRRPFAVQSSMGYSSTYKTTIIGSTSTGFNTNVTGATSISFNYDPSGNSNGSFAGTGTEIWFRRSTSFKTPNAADNAFFTQFSMTDGVTSGDFNDTSDRNLKENITTITNGYDVIKDLNPVTFDWKDANKGNGLGGFIAQEVETVLPNDVLGEDYAEGDRGQPLTDGKSINTTSIVAHLVKAVQELKAENDSLKTRIETLEG